MPNAVKPLVIGLDIGTTSTIGILVELPDRVVAVASRPTTLSSPHPGWAEEDPLEWWANSCAVLRELMRASGPDAASRRHLRHRHGAGDRASRRAMASCSGRASSRATDAAPRRSPELAAEIDERAFLAKAGNGVNQQLLAAKSRWLERHEPAVFAKIATVFGSYDYINWRLTGVRGVERNWALEAGLIDLTDGRARR